MSNKVDDDAIYFTLGMMKCFPVRHIKSNQREILLNYPQREILLVGSDLHLEDSS